MQGRRPRESIPEATNREHNTIKSSPPCYQGKHSDERGPNDVVGISKNYNGVSVFRDQRWLSNEDMELFMDAAASIGMGIYMGGKWAQAKWGTHFPNETSSNNSTFLEYFPILVALHIFGYKIRNKKVLFHVIMQK